MRRLALFLTGGAIWLLLLAIPALADGGPHVRGQAANAATGSCAGCHRAHSGQGADLIKVKDALPALCYTCHGTGTGGATTDVMNGVGYADISTAHTVAAGIPPGAGALRGGGFEYALIATGTLAAQPSGMPSNGSTLGRMAVIPNATTAGVTTSAHSVDGSPVTMWGAGPDGSADTGKASVKLTCASCHDPHGNGQYRILKPTPADVVADANVAAVKINDGTATNPDGSPKRTYTTTNYGQGGQSAADTDAESALNTDGSGLNYTVSTRTFQGTYFESSSRWCALCHTRYFGTTGAAGNKDWTEGGSADPVFTFRHATRNTIDPLTNGAPTSGVIGPLTAGSQIRANGTSDTTYSYSNLRLGTYTSSGITYRGVAVIDRTLLVAPFTVSSTSAIASAAGAGELLANGAPRCITCHVSHGSNANAGSVTTTQTSLVTDKTLGSTLLRLDGRTVCQACHAK